MLSRRTLFKTSLATWTSPVVLSISLPAHAMTSCADGSLIVGTWDQTEPSPSGSTTIYEFSEDCTGSETGVDRFGLGFGSRFTWLLSSRAITLNFDELPDSNSLVLTVSEDFMLLVAEDGTPYMKRT